MKNQMYITLLILPLLATGCVGSTVYHIDNLLSILLLIFKNVASVPPQLNPRYRILYITKNPPLQGTLERSVLSDRLLVAYVPLPAEGSASVPPCPNPGLKSIK